MSGPPKLAPHVEAAIQRGAGIAQATQATQAAQPKTFSNGGSTPLAPHVQAAIQKCHNPTVLQRQVAPAGYVTYEDVKAPTSPPPPPRWPVYALHCADGESCAVEDLKTGRVRPAGDMFAGFVRVSPRGPVYLSPRPDVGAAGDSHPTIASMTPEERTGRKKLVAAGEVGIREGRIVGHNDKTGHYRTRRNYWQSGLPSDKYHPFTEDPKEWYGK